MRTDISLYLDTSVVVSSLTNERRSSEIRSWLDEQQAELCTSDWVATEVAAALAIKVRTREISAEQQTSLRASFVRLRQASLRQLAFRTEFFAIAADIASRTHVALRAGDALHLAICVHHRSQLCTLDGNQAKAATELGLDTTLL